MDYEKNIDTEESAEELEFQENFKRISEQMKEKRNAYYENIMQEINKDFEQGIIPQALKDFYDHNLPVRMDSFGTPKELMGDGNIGRGWKSERYIEEDQIVSLPKEVLFYIYKFKRPDYILKTFDGGSIKAKESKMV